MSANYFIIDPSDIQEVRDRGRQTLAIAAKLFPTGARRAARRSVVRTRGSQLLDVAAPKQPAATDGAKRGQPSVIGERTHGVRRQPEDLRCLRRRHQLVGIALHLYKCTFVHYTNVRNLQDSRALVATVTL